MHDAHNHLHLLESRSSGTPDLPPEGQRWMVAGLHPDDWHALVHFHQRSPNTITPAFGIHPWRAQFLPEDWPSTLRKILESHPTAAVGECGLDRLRCPLAPAQQTRLLETHLRLAHDLGRGVVLHVVRAWDLATPILDADAGQRPVLLHSFSPRGLNGQPWKRWNAWFSFRASRLTHADPALVELITGLPPDRLLIESDAHPDNHSIGGAQAQVNRCLSDSVRAIAAILQKDPAEIESRTDANFALWCAACREA